MTQQAQQQTAAVTPEVPQWYEASTGNHQGLVIDERTGENIAVTYDKTNARLIAAAPDLLRACKALLASWANESALTYESVEQANAAIQKAEGA